MVQFVTEVPEISMDGFQVVSGEMFVRLPRKNEPTCTLWYNSICFGKMAMMALNNCERIRIEVNVHARKILIIPVSVKDKDNVRWITTGKNPQPRKIDCKTFTSQLYDAWGFDKDLNYRAYGRVVAADKKVMMLFDFTTPETWKSRTPVKE